MRLSWRPGSLANTSLRVMFWQGVRLICLAAWVVLAAHTLGAKDYGLFSGIVGTASALAGLVGLGSGMLMYQYGASDRLRFPRYWKQTLMMTMLTGVPIGGIAIALAWGHAGLTPLSIVMIAVSEVVAFPFLTNAVFAFSANDRLGWAAALPAAGAALRLLAVAIFSWMPTHQDLPVYLYLHLAASVLAATLALTAARTLLPEPQCGFSFSGGDLKHGLGHAASWTTATSVTTLDKSFVLHAGGDNTAGLYAACYRIAAVTAMPLDAMVMSAMPRLFRADRSTGQHTRLILAMAGAAVAYSALAGISLWWAAGLLPRVLGHDFADAITPLRWMGLFVLAYSLRQIACNALVGRGQKLRKTVIEATGLIAMAVLSAWLVPQFGVLGAAWMVMIVEMAMASAAWILVYSRGGDRGQIRPSTLSNTRA